MPKPSARSPSITSQESYSAVIIADLVAEVRVPPDCEPVRKMRSPSVKSKEETNFGYDGQMDTESSSPAVVRVDATESVIPKGSRTNVPGISKGVILNAMQFVQPDSKLQSISEKNEKQIMQTSSSLPMQVPENKEESNATPISSSCSEMSLSRKVAFGFSFLPSVLFVLCFAIILPCEKTPLCVQDQWMIEFNNTDVTSRLQVRQDNVIFTLTNEEANNVTSIDGDSGKVLWNRNLGARIRYLDCGKVQRNESIDCIIQDEAGKLYAINGSNGELIWNRNISENEMPSLPSILADCNNDGILEIAVAVSKAKIKVIFKGYKAFLIDVYGCDSTPSKLIAWPRQNTTNLIYVCRKGVNDIMFTIPQNLWCINEKKIKEEHLSLFSSNASLKDSSILPTKDGIILWVEDEVHMVLENGTAWSAPTLLHPNKNRFVLYGKFNNKGNQVALISSDITTQFQVTTFDSLTGNATWSKVTLNAEVSDAILIQGEKKDYAFVLMKTVKKDLKTEAVVHLNEVSTSIMNFIIKEEVNGSRINITSPILEEIALMPLDGSNRHTIKEKEMLYSNGMSQQLTATVTLKSEDPTLKAFVLSTLQDGSKVSQTQLKRIDISNWDFSNGKSSKCVWN